MPSPIAKAEEMKRRYQREAVITASPAMRLLMLFDKMILDLRLADDGFERGDFKAISDALCRVQEILLALRGTLRADLWSGASDLSRLYFVLWRELLDANLEKDRTRVQQVNAVVVDLAGAWRQAAEQEASRPSETPVGVGS
jgi:flagellar protein FliS